MAQMPGICKRRNGWHPKPRLWRVYGREGEGAEKWEHDTKRSIYWLYLGTPADEPYYNKLFMETIGLPRDLFWHYVAAYPGLRCIQSSELDEASSSS